MKTIRIETPEIQDFEKEHAKLVRKLAPECMVLLKNSGVLPLCEVGKVALFGNGARQTIKGGTGSGDVNVREFVNVEQGLKKAGFTITTKAWMDHYDMMKAEKKTAFYKELRRQADELQADPMFYAMGKELPEPEYEIPLSSEEKTDTAIYILARNSGEGSDRKPAKGDLLLTDTEIHDILALNKMFEKFVLVLNVGGMVDLSPIDEVGTILLMGQLGQATGDALADVLSGKAYPSGKLTMTWAPIEAYPSTKGFADPDDTDYTEGIYVGYRYFDTVGYAPDYPFGYGLSYTTFSVEPYSVCADEKQVSVTAKITNTGKLSGKEVLQVYYSAPHKNQDKPWQELAGYAKTKELKPGESELLTVHYPTEWMSSYDTVSSSYVLEEGIYYIRVGNSSRNTVVAGSIILDDTVVIEKNKAICGSCGFEDLQPDLKGLSYEGEADEIKAAPVIYLQADMFTTRISVYQDTPEEITYQKGCSWEEVVNGSRSIDEFIAGLTKEQLTYLCIGAFKESDNILEVIGNASKSVAGAAGETTYQLNELGLPTLVMADGPAGLRLSQKYKLVEEGCVSVGSSFNAEYMSVYSPEELLEKFGGSAQSVNNDKEEAIYYQYCIAIPIGTNIAQAWNISVAEQLGDIIGAEMEQFGIHLWLAPAMNIYRSPLCGRNFEYYSEDPVISGLVAAAFTNAVQKHAGCATTIKHYAMNNQETNRYFSNSNVSERAIREIYLKGFEICVKQSQPHFVMSSYNLVNGEHACNSKDLQTYTLRDEWGYEGVVMTDWLVTGGMGERGAKWPCASAAGNIHAGNDLTMPGMPSDKADIIAALERDKHPYALTMAELQLSAKRILGMILKLA